MPVETRVVVADELRPALNARVCDFSKSYGFLIAFLVFKAILIVVGFTQTLRIWNLKHSNYNGTPLARELRLSNMSIEI